MKKRLESELISIAHRILKLKNKSEIDQLYKETQKLYETLAVLKFYHENFESVKSDVSEEVLIEKLEQFNESSVLEKTEVNEDAKYVVEVEAEIPVKAEPEADEEVEAALEIEEEETTVSEVKEELVEEVLEEEEALTDAEPAFIPAFELEVEEEEEVQLVQPTIEEKHETKKIALEHFLGENYVDPIFVKPNEVSLFSSEVKEELPTRTQEEPKEESKVEAPKTAAMNDAMSKSIAIGLNDRIGFVQHLFNDSNEDFNRVISQLNTFDTFEEAKTFINEMVIPDYNYWVGKEDYLERFMEIVEKKFD
ncbi:hypothetical protein [Flavobacterium sp.]|uniref:hypothetical protein n=1 Tax=Flavobacterium sp. TaxID=239 RepID=UPI002487EBFE|nr:hypothetical protein [Flavobacterium sp.]MDI1316695.1 hypothetical protein [Flavobacterium sp.]